MQMPETAINFERLRKRLLEGGVAHRHVKRTLAELDDHFIEAWRSEEAAGLNGPEAEARAWQRLGSEDEIVRTTLARPELRSLPARFPRLVFGAGPLVLWIGVLALTIFGFASLNELNSSGPPSPRTPTPEWVRAPLNGLAFFYFRILPLLIGLWIFTTAIRLRLSKVWPAMGLVLLCLFSGTTDFGLTFANSSEEMSEFEFGNHLVTIVSFFPVSSSIFGTFEPEKFWPGFGLGLFNLLVIVSMLRLWQHYGAKGGRDA